MRDTLPAECPISTPYSTTRPRRLLLENTSPTLRHQSRIRIDHRDSVTGLKVRKDDLDHTKCTDDGRDGVGAGRGLIEGKNDASIEIRKTARSYRAVGHVDGSVVQSCTTCDR